VTELYRHQRTKGLAGRLNDVYIDLVELGSRGPD